MNVYNSSYCFGLVGYTSLTAKHGSLLSQKQQENGLGAYRTYQVELLRGVRTEQFREAVKSYWACCLHIPCFCSGQDVYHLSDLPLEV